VKDSYNLFFIFISISSHGSWTKDKSKDEKDGRDELIVPVDYKKSGCISDDELYQIFHNLNPKCHVIMKFDCCHSGTLLDLMYKWNTRKKATIENALCDIQAKILTISGCADSQTSADAMINGKYSGALTSTFLSSIKETNDSFKLLELIRDKLKEQEFTQVPQICTTYNLAKEPEFFPIIKRIKRKRKEL
jgi:metacaspase-1